MNLNQIDIKLLPILDALLQERSVTKAAKRVGRSQPAVSHALRRLRGLLQNELLVRVGMDYELTAEAEAMAPQLHAALQRLSDVLVPQPAFDPLTAEREFTITATDYLSAWILGPTIQKLAVRAPGVRLGIVDEWGPQLVSRLRGAPGCIAIYPANERPKVDGLEFEFLIKDSFCCAAWAGNTLVGDAVTKEMFVSIPHIVEFFAPNQAEVFLEKYLIEIGCPRPYMVRSPYVLLMPFLLEGTNALAVLPRRMAERLCQAADLRIFPLPFETPEFDIEMCWSARYTTDPAHAWLRSVVKEAAQSL